LQFVKKICAKFKKQTKSSGVFMKISLIIMFFSFAVCANEISSQSLTTGVVAEQLYKSIKGFEYSVGANTSAVQYNLTVKHDDQHECQKEETHYLNEKKTEVEFSCKSALSTPAVNTLICSDKNQQELLQLKINGSTAQINYKQRELDCIKLVVDNSSLICTSLDFETSEVVILKLQVGQKGQIEFLPAPGSGKIEQASVDCEIHNPS
jgi:hypothetical protein